MNLKAVIKIHEIVDADVSKRYEDKCSIREETWLFRPSGDGGSWQDIMALDIVDVIMLLRKLLEAKQVEEGCKWWRYGEELKFVKKEGK